jgi:hypothetical protein
MPVGNPKTNTGETSMTAIMFNTASQVASRGSRPLRRNACATDAVAVASHVEMIKRVCRFSLTNMMLTVAAAGIVKPQIVNWIPHFNH